MTSDIKLKAFLYGLALFLTPFSDKLIPILFSNEWPSLQMTIGCTLMGIIACSIGIRAYLDGSYERSKQTVVMPAAEVKDTTQPVVDK